MTHPFPSRAAQRGAVLIVGLIVLILITLMVTTAFKLSTTNLKSVGNMQSRNEAIAAANKALEQVIGSWDFATPSSVDHISVDIDNNGTTDYVVEIAAPVCVRAVASAGGVDRGSECMPLGDGTYQCTSTDPERVFNVVWDIDATATGSSSGTRLKVRQGISRSLSQSQCDAACPPAPGTPCV